MSLMRNPTIKQFMNYRVIKQEPGAAINGLGEDSRLDENAIKLLIKKLKSTKQLGELEKALNSRSASTPCVPVPRNFDMSSISSNGHAGSGSRSPFISNPPCFTYCKLFRWVDLSSVHELKSIEICQHPFSHKSHDNVCINPYHYTRLDMPSLRPVLIPTSIQYSPVTLHDGHTPLSLPPTYGDVTVHSECALEYLQYTHDHLNHSLTNSDHLLHSVNPYPTPPPAYPEESSSDRSSPPSFGTMSNPTSPYYAPHLSTPLASPDDAHSVYPHQPSNGYDHIPIPTPGMIKSIRFEEQMKWCNIYYYEMDNRVGEVFYALKPTLVIDGFTEPNSDDRFCLGLLSNVHRDNPIELARRHIGRGVRLSYIAGEVFAECISDSPIFVQSPNCNLTSGWHPATVCKLPPNCTLKIFNYQDFGNMLSNSVSKGFEAVHQLTRMCSIRISFVKGWGAEYRRQTVTSTPCWIEIHLNGALRWLDKVLQSMGSPNDQCGSRS